MVGTRTRQKFGNQKLMCIRSFRSSEANGGIVLKYFWLKMDFENSDLEF